MPSTPLASSASRSLPPAASTRRRSRASRRRASPSTPTASARPSSAARTISLPTSFSRTASPLPRSDVVTSRTSGSRSSLKNFPGPADESRGGADRGLSVVLQGAAVHVAAPDLPRPARLLLLAHARLHASRQADRGRAGLEIRRRLGGHRRRRRGRHRTPGGRRLPPAPQALLRSRRACPEGDPSLRPAGNRQDA